MGAPELEYIFESVVREGSELGTTAEIIQFPSDNGANTFNVVSKTIQTSNGSSGNILVNAYTAIVGAVTSAVSAGSALVALDVGTLGLAVAPALGITTGLLMYNLAPDFWTNLDLAIYGLGYTIGNKVVSFVKDDGTLLVPEDVINAYKDAFCDAGIFPESTPLDEHYNVNDDTCVSFDTALVESYMYTTEYMNEGYKPAIDMSTFVNRFKARFAELGYNVDEWLPLAYSSCNKRGSLVVGGQMKFAKKNSLVDVSLVPAALRFDATDYPNTPLLSLSYSLLIAENEFYPDWQPINGITATNMTFAERNLYDRNSVVVGEYSQVGYYVECRGLDTATGGSEIVIPDTVYPSPDDPVTTTYPEWFPIVIPFTYPAIVPFNYPIILPLEYPNVDAEIDPEGARRPAPDIGTGTRRAIDDKPEIGEGARRPHEDPDPSSDPDPITPDIGDGARRPDPPEPDPPVPPTPVIPDPIPTTLNSNKLFTVYNPSDSALNSLGAYLWDSSLIETLKKIWQDPLDGIISLIQIYATPTTGSSQHIILGYLDSNVSAPVVTSQFVTIDCGSVTLNEVNQNMGDYIPYTSLHVFLPFIGIVELDVNECMRGTINIKYRIDVYTGTCIAVINVTRTGDLPNGGTIYQFTGNCSQQIPLTSGSANGLLNTLVTGIGACVAVGAGGGSGAVMGGGAMLSALSKEMVHVSHSGNMGANAGILGNKKPYLIIGRAKPYNATEYSKYIGYPSNKTVYIGNCSGFIKCKADRFISTATDEEMTEIISLLHGGVIV